MVIKVIIDFLNQNNGALMVLITVAYVIATCFIVRENRISANAAKQQLEEMKLQYKETKKSDVFPYLTFARWPERCECNISLYLGEEDSDAPVGSYNFTVKNIGKGSAINLQYKWINLIKAETQGRFSFNGLGVGDINSVRISFSRSNSCEEAYSTAILELIYCDLLDNKYSQNIEFEFDFSGGGFALKRHTVFSPVLHEEELKLD